MSTAVACMSKITTFQSRKKKWKKCNRRKNTLIMIWTISSLLLWIFFCTLQVAKIKCNCSTFFNQNHLKIIITLLVVNNKIWKFILKKNFSNVLVVLYSTSFFPSHYIILRSPCCCSSSSYTKILLLIFGDIKIHRHIIINSII